MNRRHMLRGCCAALGAGLFTGLVPQAVARVRNPCRGRLGPIFLAERVQRECPSRCLRRPKALRHRRRLH